MELSILISVVFLSLVGALEPPRVVKHTFDISYITGSPDGVQTNHILSINGKFPGPTIEAQVGDILEVLVRNNIQDGQNVSIHWHGIHQSGTPFEDGASQMTQCPVKNGKHLLYSFYLNQAGTYWYHSHVNSQSTEGLWGALIVRNSPEVYENQYEGEILLSLNEWYHQSAHENEAWHISVLSGGEPPFLHTALLNGHGRYPCGWAWLEGRDCNEVDQYRPVLSVSPGSMYRVRLINTSGRVSFNFSIDAHKLQAIEVDGVDLAEPISAEAVSISPGQRYSFLLKTSQSPSRYIIRANVRKELLFVRPGANINKYPDAVFGVVSGILEYSDVVPVGCRNDRSPLIQGSLERFDYFQTIPPQPVQNPLFLNESLLVPYDRVPTPPTFDQEFLLKTTFHADEENIRRGSFNYTPFVLPTGKPLLVRMLQDEAIPESAFPLHIGYRNVVQIIINNPYRGPHPIHLHGHHFWVLGSGLWGDGDYDREKHTLDLNGVRRDTAVVWEYSWLVIRFIADNPGLWTLHCHIDWHNLSGMAATFIEAADVAKKLYSITEETRSTCLAHGIDI